ncbi:MAG: hypothetical protein FWF49_01305 [Oscillospiraceae bacterium]|nr:hypothetical protein [Oscillospiraceae bacterium]
MKPFATTLHLRATFFENALSKNIVLIQGLSLCPVILCGATLLEALWLSLAAAVALLPVAVMMSLVGGRIPSWLRPPIYTVAASLLLVGVAVLVNTVSPGMYLALYYFLPLMAVNTLMLYRASGFAVHLKPVPALIDGLSTAVGFALVICIVGALREIAVSGTVLGFDVNLPFAFDQAAQPYVGFLLLGFMAALLQWINHSVARMREHKGKEVTAP